ncbi:MAG: DUF2135 domain-containing protein [Kiritimatiellae bacterium]|nr:DUF2135 domain-containing protein [Kiritimatiellia bacterium]
MNKIIPLPAAFAIVCSAVAQTIVPTPVFRPASIAADEKPVAVETSAQVVEENAFFQKVETTIVFTNPNPRVFEGELELPLPDGATVCGYSLEVNGTMVPGVVCEKEKARVAFENEKRKGVDPGIVENVKGNVWRTRIYPLEPGKPRRAKIVHVAEREKRPEGVSTIFETDGEEVFAATVREPVSRAGLLRQAAKASIFWDASMSRDGKTAADRALLENLPETGEWKLHVFRDTVAPAQEFTTRAELLAAVDALVYDGATCLDLADRLAEESGNGFVFTDERDCELRAGRRIEVRKAKDGECAGEVAKGTLLATVWAADRIAELSSAPDANRRELAELGRKYCIASPVTSLIVLETLEQYLQYSIEPPKTFSFHGEWVRRRAAEDDQIAAERERTEHRQALLSYWEERVKWWNDPIPPSNTPKSGLFDTLSDGSAASDGDGVEAEEPEEMLNAAAGGGARRNAHAFGRMRMSRREPADSMAAVAVADAAKTEESPESASSGAATVTIKPWDPETPYLKAIGAAKDKYAEYIVQRKSYGDSPAFYLDCAGLFFKEGEGMLARRIISNLAEMRLEDIGLWRTMGWRLREAGAYDEAVAAFRHVLCERGEEPQSRRDLALVLAERGKGLFASGERVRAAQDLEEAAKLMFEAAFTPSARRSGRRGNDMQTAVFALEELNGLAAWIVSSGWGAEKKPAIPEIEAAFRRDMPLAMRIVLSWDADETDVDLHVLEPDGEEAFYGHRRTKSGGFVSEDVTTGYGPEEYLRKDSKSGKYRILANYYASHRQALTGAAVVTATVYTGWGRADERREILSFRLDKPKDKNPIGEIDVE